MALPKSQERCRKLIVTESVCSMEGDSAPVTKILPLAGPLSCGTALSKEHLINHARTLISSTANPPYVAEEIGTASRLVRPPLVLHGSARLRFSLTSGISDDELVRLESSLNNWREQEGWSAAVARA